MACSGSFNNDGNIEDIVYQKESYDLFAAEWVNRIEAVPLETNDSLLLGTLLELLPPVSEGFYVVDRGGSDKLLSFNFQGEFIRSIGRRGNGPGEYTKLEDAHIEGEFIEIHAWKGWLTRYTYTKDGQFLQARSFPYIGNKLINWGNYDWVYVNYSNRYSPDRLIKVNATGKKVKGFLPSKAKVLPFLEKFPVFSRYGDRLFFRESFNNTVYEIMESGVVPRYRFDFGHLNVPDSYFKYSDHMEAAMDLKKTAFVTIDYFSENDYYTLVRASIQGDKMSKLLGLKHKGRQEWQWFTHPQNGELSALFSGYFVLGKDAVLYGLVMPEKLMQLNTSERKKIINAEILDGLREDDNPVILKFVLEE